MMYPLKLNFDESVINISITVQLFHHYKFSTVKSQGGEIKYKLFWFQIQKPSHTDTESEYLMILYDLMNTWYKGNPLFNTYCAS